MNYMDYLLQLRFQICQNVVDLEVFIWMLFRKENP